MPEEESEDSREGVLLHNYSAHPEYDRAFLKPHQRDLLELSASLREKVIERLGFGDSYDKILVEEKLEGEGVPPGTPDEVLFFYRNHAAIVIDEKFGFIVVERAELNLQLRNYAVLAADYSPVQLAEIYVAIIQPRAPYDQRITLARYNLDDIKSSRQEIQSIIALSESDQATLNPGEEQCRHCKARLICPALQAAMETSLAPFVPQDKLTKTARTAFVENRLSECSDEQLSKILQAISFSGFISDAAKEEARKRIRNGTLTDYTLGKEGKIRTIADTPRALVLLGLARVLDRDKAIEMADLKVGRVEDAYREATKVSAKEAREKVDKVLASVMEITARKPSILRK